MPVLAWILIGVFTTGWHVLLGAGQLHLWLVREASSKGSSNSRKSAEDLFCGMKIPFVPAMTLVQAALLALFFGLTGSNVANGSNGMSSFLYAFLVLIIGAQCTLFLLKFVRLGHRLIGRGLKWTSSLANKRELSTFGGFGKTAVVLSCVSLASYFILFAVCGAARTPAAQ